MSVIQSRLVQSHDLGIISGVHELLDICVYVGMFPFDITCRDNGFRIVPLYNFHMGFITCGRRVRNLTDMFFYKTLVDNNTF